MSSQRGPRPGTWMTRVACAGWPQDAHGRLLSMRRRARAAVGRPGQGRLQVGRVDDQGEQQVSVHVVLSPPGKRVVAPRMEHVNDPTAWGQTGSLPCPPTSPGTRPSLESDGRHCHGWPQPTGRPGRRVLQRQDPRLLGGRPDTAAGLAHLTPDRPLPAERHRPGTERRPRQPAAYRAAHRHLAQ